MKKIYLIGVMAVGMSFLLNGCIAAIGNGNPNGHGTLGQQLIDLQKAKEAGAITDSEYQIQKARLLK